MENELVRIVPHTLPMKLDKPLLVYVNDNGPDVDARTASVIECDDTMWLESDHRGDSWDVSWRYIYRHPREDQSRYDAIERKQTRRMCLGEMVGKFGQNEHGFWYGPIVCHNCTLDDLKSPTNFDNYADTYADIVAGNIKSTEVEV